MKFLKIKKEVLQSALLMLVIMVVGAFVLWSLGTFSDALKTQLLQ